MYVLEPVNECTKTVLFVTFIIRASLVDPPPPSGYSRLGPAASITNVVMVTVVATYITVSNTMGSCKPKLDELLSDHVQ